MITLIESAAYLVPWVDTFLRLVTYGTHHTIRLLGIYRRLFAPLFPNLWRRLRLSARQSNTASPGPGVIAHCTPRSERPATLPRPSDYQTRTHCVARNVTRGRLTSAERFTTRERYYQNTQFAVMFNPVEE